MNKQQLANKIWASANKMRSKIEANEYKDYILGLIFYKFLSDNEVNYLKKNDWTDEDLPDLVEDYESEDAKTMIDFCKKNVGYFIEYKNLFSTWLLPNASFSVADLSVALNAFDRNVGEDYKEVFEGIFKSLQAGLSKLGENPSAQTRALKDLIKLIKDIPTDNKQGYDVLGYVYEYLISNFAASAGKKAGEFYTPHEVSELMSLIVAEHHRNKDKIEIYDATSGSGSLLITIGKSVGKYIQNKNSVKYYAQELKENTYNLTRMNLVMRGINPANIDTRCADSLEEDWPLDKSEGNIGQPLRVDAVVSNPPYSQHWNPTDAEYDARFKDYGVAPKTKADYAFLLHELHHLKSDGIMTIVLPHGVLFRTGEEENIRKRLIEKNNIDAIIGLPANIFFGTGIPTLIMVLKQHRDNDDVMIIDASKGFVKDGKSNKLRACDIKKIADTWRDRIEIEGYSRRVSRELIRENEYNMNIPRYVDSSEPPVKYDIYATLHGGIPNKEIDDLKEYWDALPSLRGQLFVEKESIPYSSLTEMDTKEVIEDNDDVKSFYSDFNVRFGDFSDYLHNRLVTNLMAVNEDLETDVIAEEIFSRIDGMPIVDKYAAYQAFRNNWQMISGDIEIIKSEGIGAARVVEPSYKLVKKGDEEMEVPDGLKGRIIPFDLIQRDKFADDLAKIDAMNERSSDISAELDDLRDNLTEDEVSEYMEGEEGALKLNKKKINADAKKKSDDIEPETKVKLKRFAQLWSDKTKTNKEINTAMLELVEKTKDALENLTDEEIEKYLHLKWIVPVANEINSILGDCINRLENSVVALNEKYKETYEEINNSISASEDILSELTKQLTGDELAVKALNELFYK